MRIHIFNAQAVWAKILGFGKDEKGVITVDWVVITAAVVTLGMGVYAMFSFEVVDPSSDELTFIGMAYMEQTGWNGMEAPNRGPIGNLIHVIQYKMILFKSCLTGSLTTMGGADLGQVDTCGMM